MKKNTPEQVSIIDGVPDSDIIKVTAFAGTGKSTTLYEITAEHNHLTYLYLVYNKSMQTEAEKKFDLSNTEVKTTHGLAMKYVFNDLKLAERNITGYLNVYDVKQHNSIREYKKALVVRNAFNLFCQSCLLNVEDADAIYNLVKADKMLYNESLDAGITLKHIAMYVRNTWALILRGDIDIYHDFYLKFFQVHIEYYSKFIHYDVIMLDEAQDSNDLTLSIFQNLKGKKIVVGDKYQAIYGWRQATNIMEKINTSSEFFLTNTFRFGDETAELANQILNKFLGENKKIKSFFSEIKKDITSTAYISRTNSGLISELARLSEKYPDKVIKTVRNPKDIFSMPLSVYYFMDNKFKNKDKITEKRLFQHRSVTEMKEFASEMKDIELLMAIKLAEDFGSGLEDLFHLAMSTTRKRKVDIYLTTAHSAKGLEWDRAIICDDFGDLVMSISNNKIKSLEALHKLIKTDYDRVKFLVEEFNLFYVAITRGVVETEIRSNNLEYLQMDIDEINEVLKKASKTVIRRK
jgi:F-box protein 18 (helicase)